MKIVRSKTAKYPTLVKFPFKDEADGLSDFKGDFGELSVRYEQGLTVIYCGLGDFEDYAPRKIRTAAADAAARLSKLERIGVSVLLPERPQDRVASDLACVEGMLLGSYDFAVYKSNSKKKLRTCQFVGMKASAGMAKSASFACEAACYARDLVNENADVIHPERLAAEARDIGKSEGFSVKVITDRQMEKMGLGLIHAVGKGSERPPRLVILEYKGDPESKEKTALIGKGITFDSGGQNMKPTGAIEDMRSDMAGAAAVLGIMKALDSIRPQINVVGVLAAAHNAVSGRAYYPGDVYTSYSGKTVEIINTDAEGRLVLADAVAYCEKHCKPSRMIDLATLTGGILIALGDSVAGLFSPDDDLADALFNAGEEVWERLWRFPLYDQYFEAMKSDRADLRNVGKLKKGYASSITGAAFIGSFVESIPWAHLDIAGTAVNEGARKGENPQFATGFGVRLILRYLGVI